MAALRVYQMEGSANRAAGDLHAEGRQLRTTRRAAEKKGGLMSQADDDDLGVNMIAGCGCASAVSLFVLAPFCVWMSLLLGSVRLAIVLGTIAVVAGPIVLTLIIWGVIGWMRWKERDEASE